MTTAEIMEQLTAPGTFFLRGKSAADLRQILGQLAETANRRARAGLRDRSGWGLSTPVISQFSSDPQINPQGPEPLFGISHLAGYEVARPYGAYPSELKAMGWTPNLSAGGKMPTVQQAQAEQAELREEINRVTQFLASQTSTRAGRAHWRRSVEAALTGKSYAEVAKQGYKYKLMTDPATARILWEAIDRAREAQAIGQLRWDSGAYITTIGVMVRQNMPKGLTSISIQQLAEDIIKAAKAAKSGNRGRLTKDQIIGAMSKETKERWGIVDP